MRRLSHAIFALVLLAAVAPITRAGDLRILNSRHYRIHTDLDRALAEDLARRLDAMYDEYSRRLSKFSVDHSGKRFDVYLFARRADYLKLTKGKSNNSAGITIPHLNIVAAFLEGEGRDELRSTLQHEAFHQFACSAIHPDMPQWLNEGLAVLFQEGIWTGRSFLVGQVPPRRIRQLQHDIDNRRLIEFTRMMSMSLEEWNATLERDKQLGATMYNQAWAMCHFLVYAAEQGTPKYRARFLDMLHRIRNDVSGMDAFRAAFSSNIDGFQTRFVQWAKALEPTRDATLIERQAILATMMIDLAKNGERFDEFSEFRERVVRSGMWMEFTLGDMKWTTDRDARVYFRSPDGRAYNTDELYFDTRSGAPLPDLVLHSVGQLKLRTRFHTIPRGIEHETVVDER